MVHLLPVPNMERAMYLILSPPRFGDPQDGRGYVEGFARGVRSDTWILKEFGPQLKDLKKGEVILLDGSFPGRKHGIISKGKEHGSRNMAIQVQRWAFLHLGPLRASVCSVVHLGCVPRPVHKIGDELGGAYPMTPLYARALLCFGVSFLNNVH